jgi:hypothetical protein
MNTLYSTDNPTKGISDEEGLHISGLDIMQIMTLLPDRIARTRYMNHYGLEPMQQIPEYILLPSFAFPLFQAIHDEVLNEQDRKGYEVVPLKKTIQRFLNDTDFTNDVIVGKYSVTDKKNKVRYLTQIPYTITDCARAYIRLCEFSAGTRLTPKYNKYKDIVRMKKGIKFFSGYYAGELAYIDIRAAYWSILWPTTLDMEYDPIKQEITADGIIPYIHCDQFAMHKQIRNVMHTLYGYRDMRIWKHEERRIRHGQMFGDRLYRPYNLAYIHDVMNAICVDVREHFTLLQWLTDGIIVPADQAEPLMEFLFQEWFLDSRLKWTGDGASNRIDMYKVGNKQTGHYNPKIVGTPHCELRSANIESLKEIRQQAKNGTLPEIRATKKKSKIFGVSPTVIQESEYKPKLRFIAAKRKPRQLPSLSISKNFIPPLPEETKDETEFLKNYNKVIKKYQGDKND